MGTLVAFATFWGVVPPSSVLGCMLLLLKRPNHDEQAAEPSTVSPTAAAAV
ncbi:hypothetical protein OH786_28315 [Streptomyces atratus]|uniref:Uncharacterized protein n=1 Tax=Streptomyces atratus TaxID=1893 RepID=A0A1K2BXR7_STRAR|nr:hypothetical protein [Streptomyces atratus]SFY03395.1 hypothetical protein SAMN02787144_1009237 [Streptomyces atratus]